MKRFLSLIFILWFPIIATSQTHEINFREDEIIFENGNSITSEMTIPVYPQTSTGIYLDYGTGDIAGSITDANRLGQSYVYSIDQLFYNEITNQNGKPSGNIKNKYFTFVKPVDKASVDLADAYLNNLPISSLTFIIWKENLQAGGEDEYFNIKLTGVKIAEFRLDGDVQSDGIGYQFVEKYVVVFQNCILEDPLNGVSTTLSWSF